MSSTGYYYRTREGEGGAGAVLVGGQLYSRFAAAVGNFWLAWGCLVGTKMHMGFLLREYRCPLATRGVSEKGSHVAQPQRKKVPTRGFSAKKEGVWRELSTKGADLRIFGEKGSRVARPLCHFSPLGEKGRWVAQPPEILYFFVYQHRLNDP